MLIIDVREPEEYQQSHVEGAVNMPPSILMTLGGALPAELQGLPKDADIIVYCRSGSRSAVALSLLQQAGFTNAKNGINQDQVNKILGRA